MLKGLLDVYPYDVAISLDDGSTYGSDAYSRKVGDALLWLEEKKLFRNKHWNLSHISGSTATIIEFKQYKDAMVFKLTFG